MAAAVVAAVLDADQRRLGPAEVSPEVDQPQPPPARGRRAGRSCPPRGTRDCRRGRGSAGSGRRCAPVTYSSWPEKMIRSYEAARARRRSGSARGPRRRGSRPACRCGRGSGGSRAAASGSAAACRRPRTAGRGARCADEGLRTTSRRLPVAVGVVEVVRLPAVGREDDRDPALRPWTPGRSTNGAKATVLAVRRPEPGEVEAAVPRAHPHEDPVHLARADEELPRRAPRAADRREAPLRARTQDLQLEPAGLAADDELGALARDVRRVREGRRQARPDGGSVRCPGSPDGRRAENERDRGDDGDTAGRMRHDLRS